MKKFFLLLSVIPLFTLCEGQYNVIINFGDTNSPRGTHPYGNVIRVGNLLYGMTYEGGLHSFGCIFSVDTNGNNYKDRWDFNQDSSSNGAYPEGDLTLSGSKLYGMTAFGGINEYGNIFCIDTNGDGYKDLWNFNNTLDSNGTEPDGSLTLSEGKLFGMTRKGGIYNQGNIFRIDTNGDGYKDLWDLGYDGPYGSLTLYGGKLYGMTAFGGINIDGSIFRIDTNGSGYKDLWDFNVDHDSNGGRPNGDLIVLGGKLYGMTYEGGIHNNGNIFRIDTNGGGYKDLWDFNRAYDSNGASPEGNLTVFGDKFYGMTLNGGTNDAGNIFRIDTNGNGYKDMFDFNNTYGKTPNGSLTLSGGVFYGMTWQGGTSDYGLVFSFQDTSIYNVTGINYGNSFNASTTIYPNPNDGSFTLSLSNVNAKSNVEIYNTLGDRVYTETLPQSQRNNTINLTAQPSGVYFYRVLKEDGGMVGAGKLIIQK